MCFIGGSFATELALCLMEDSVYSSAVIEGFKTSKERVSSILSGVSYDEVPRFEQFFVLNMQNAWKFLLETVGCPNNLAYLRQLNNICGKDLFYGNGQIRQTEVTITGTDYVPAVPFESDIADTITKIDSLENRELCALKMFCYVARTQMFIDGNKRVAQLIANKILMDANVGIFQVPVEQVETFKKLLVGYYESNDDFDLIEFLYKNCINRNTGNPLDPCFCDIFNEFTAQDTPIELSLKSMEALRAHIDIEKDMTDTLMPLLADCWLDYKHEIVNFIESMLGITHDDEM